LKGVTKTMLTKIFCEIDDFMQEFEEKYKKRLISDKSGKVKYNSRLTLSEVMSILVYYRWRQLEN